MGYHVRYSGSANLRSTSLRSFIIAKVNNFRSTNIITEKRCNLLLFIFGFGLSVGFRGGLFGWGFFSGRFLGCGFFSRSFLDGSFFGLWLFSRAVLAQ